MRSLVPIREFDRRLGWTEGFAAQIHDGRTILEMIRQRVFGILAGYEDQYDHDTLRSDGIFKLIAGRSPDDPTHGAQQLTFVHGFYEQYQYLVRVITCAENDLVVSRYCCTSRLLRRWARCRMSSAWSLVTRVMDLAEHDRARQSSRRSPRLDTSLERAAVALAQLPGMLSLEPVE